MNIKIKREKRLKRHRRVRAKIIGTDKRPRLCVFRSLKHTYAQLVDDERAQTLAAANSLEIEKLKSVGEDQKILTKKIALAHKTGKLIAERALNKKIKKVIFDRGGYKYHGRVRALADGAREGGMKF